MFQAGDAFSKAHNVFFYIKFPGGIVPTKLLHKSSSFLTH